MVPPMPPAIERLDFFCQSPENLAPPREKCAVVGIIDRLGQDVSPLVVLGLEALQGRGQDGAGLASFKPDGSFPSTFRLRKKPGLVKDVFFQDSILDACDLRSPLAIGHTRYATAGTKGQESCFQPFVVESDFGTLALAQNGNTINTGQLRDLLSPHSITYQSDSDGEVIAHLITVSPGKSWPEKIENALRFVRGSYSLVMATGDGQLIAVRDPLAIRPLWAGYNSQSVIFASETVAFQRIPVHMREEVKGGQMIVVEKGGLIQKKQIFPSDCTAECLVERLYIGHVMSEYDGQELKKMREKMGENLAREHPMPEVDIICGIPDSALPIAEGYARAFGRRVNPVIIKDRYSAGIRSFIQGTDSGRVAVLEGKFYVSDEVDGKSVLTIDDSGIRGATDEILNAKLKQRGAKEIHVLKASPKFVDICDLGIDISDLKRLIALESDGNGWYRELTEAEIAQKIGANSVGYLSLKGLIRATGRPVDDFCTHCWTHQHPILDHQAEELWVDSGALQVPKSSGTLYVSS